MSVRIGFAGMTHLGLVSATAVASRGFPTVCFDPNAGLVADLAKGKLPVLEPGLDDLLASNSDKQVFTSSIADLAQCDVVYVAPDIPTDDQGRSDTATIHRLIDAVTPALNPQAAMVVLSQVEPGFTRALKAPDPSRRYYQVETLIFGRAVERATQPERYIVGCADPAVPLDAKLRAVLAEFNCPILPMRYESAELAKISINFCLVSSISVANTLAEVCEEIGADWSEIVPALKLDRRIGQYSYLAPGLGIAGGNLERDLATVCRIADRKGTDAGVVRAWIANSRYRRDWALRLLHEKVLVSVANPSIGVLGIAYKEDTHSTKNSPSLTFMQALGPFLIRAYDPVVPAASVGDTVEQGKSAIDACAGADVVAVMTPWKEFRALAPEEIARSMRGKIIIDPYAVLDAGACAKAGLEHYVMGRELQLQGKECAQAFE
ncbi:MAG: nucleotide sugar dehydrogenase [Hyphomicrobium sp.]|uniref:nucleotide sugar dehydrogenase n=1 Tax=Hyphomicrobium sp. TaxID=82 RepID=UPI00132A0C3C|nr:nucleotide sugar dehydrogenase [Hyphomicrobium sp.]KAB2939005.1 MAG: nucleotide sugar dehydrogenase [Hyphomicrobium sp.]MBZ0211767.1 nucleotide sugar dehydrogenase [Hyphomicrobium sp.]